MFLKPTTNINKPGNTPLWHANKKHVVSEFTGKEKQICGIYFYQ